MTTDNSGLSCKQTTTTQPTFMSSRKEDPVANGSIFKERNQQALRAITPLPLNGNIHRAYTPYGFTSSSPAPQVNLSEYLRGSPALMHPVYQPSPESFPRVGVSNSHSSPEGPRGNFDVGIDIGFDVRSRFLDYAHHVTPTPVQNVNNQTPEPKKRKITFCNWYFKFIRETATEIKLFVTGKADEQDYWVDSAELVRRIDDGTIESASETTYTLTKDTFNNDLFAKENEIILSEHPNLAEVFNGCVPDGWHAHLEFEPLPEPTDVEWLQANEERLYSLKDMGVVKTILEELQKIENEFNPKEPIVFVDMESQTEPVSKMVDQEAQTTNEHRVFVLQSQEYEKSPLRSQDIDTHVTPSTQDPLEDHVTINTQDRHDFQPEEEDFSDTGAAPEEESRVYDHDSYVETGGYADDDEYDEHVQDSPDSDQHEKSVEKQTPLSPYDDMILWSPKIKTASKPPKAPVSSKKKTPPRKPIVFEDSDEEVLSDNEYNESEQSQDTSEVSIDNDDFNDVLLSQEPAAPKTRRAKRKKAETPTRKQGVKRKRNTERVQAESLHTLSQPDEFGDCIVDVITPPRSKRGRQQNKPVAFWANEKIINYKERSVIVGTQDHLLYETRPAEYMRSGQKDSNRKKYTDGPRVKRKTLEGLTDDELDEDYVPPTHSEVPRKNS